MKRQQALLLATSAGALLLLRSRHHRTPGQESLSSHERREAWFVERHPDHLSVEVARPAGQVAARLASGELDGLPRREGAVSDRFRWRVREAECRIEVHPLPGGSSCELQLFGPVSPGERVDPVFPAALGTLRHSLEHSETGAAGPARA